MSTAERSGIFIAYHYPEKRWLDRVQAALKTVPGAERVVVWDDRKLLGGFGWKAELNDVLAKSKVAMMIVSDPFLQSGFLSRAKLPALLDREREHGLRICWVLAGYCLFSVAGFRTDEAGNGINSALDGLSGPARDAEIAEIARKVGLLLGVASPAPAPAPVTTADGETPKAEAGAAPPASPAPTEDGTKPIAPAPAEEIVKPEIKRRRRAAAAKAEAIAELPLELKPVLPATPLPTLPLAPPPPQPQLQFPGPKPQTHLLPPVPESAPTETPAAIPEPLAEEPPPRRSESPLLPALEAVIHARQESIVQSRRCARWLKVAALLLGLISLPVALSAGLTHFLLLFGFALFLGSLAFFLHARIALLGQRLVGLRYTRSGLADELLPNRQREPLLRKAAEALG